MRLSKPKGQTGYPQSARNSRTVSKDVKRRNSDNTIAKSKKRQEHKKWMASTTQKTTNRAIWISLKTECEIMFSGKVTSSFLLHQWAPSCYSYNLFGMLNTVKCGISLYTEGTVNNYRGTSFIIFFNLDRTEKLCTIWTLKTTNCRV